MTLRAYFRMDQQESGIRKNNLEKYAKEIIYVLDKIPFGKLKKLDMYLLIIKKLKNYNIWKK